MSKDTIKKCNNCRLANELNTEEIPFWSKRNENYSPYPKMITCDPNYSLKNEDLKDILPELDENSLEAHLTLGSDNSDKYVFYWAANPQKDIHKILGPKEAYGDYENHGLLKCDDKGEVILKFNPPQPYKEDSKTNPRHIHYLLESSERTWLPLKTIRIIQSASLEYLDERIKTKDMIILNALPEKYYKKDKIPSSYNLPTESLDKYTNESKCRKVKNFLKSILKHYPKIESLVNDKHLVLEDVPILTYCAHSKCDASDKLIDHLYECKFNNTQEFKGGIEEYNKNRSFFPDIDEEVDVDDDDGGDDDSDDDGDGDGVDYEEISDEEDDDYIDIIYQGIEYSYLDGILYDESLNPIGEATVKNGKIKSMSDECKKYHKKMKGEADDDEPETKVEDKYEPEPEIESEEEDEEEDESEKSDDDEPKPVSEAVESDESDDEDSYDEESINKLKGGKGTLRIILKNIASREKNSYTYGNIKNMKKDKLVEIALTCQGKRVCSKKSDYKYKTKDEIESMNEKQLRELLNDMINREPGTFKYSESSWARDKLIHFILTCQGSSKPSQIGRTSFVGGGWCL